MELHIVKYCADECFRQGSGELSVYDMCNAWEWARAKWEYCPTCAYAYKRDNVEFPHDRLQNKVDLQFIERLGTLVEPAKNKAGFRTIPIYVGNGFEMIEKAPWNRVPELLTLLFDSYYAGVLEPDHRLAQSAEDQFYYEYENIHPFRDGNGRTGKIIYNYLKGTMDNPILPPNFWNISNP